MIAASRISPTRRGRIAVALIAARYPAIRGDDAVVSAGFLAAAPGRRDAMKLLVLTSEPITGQQLRDALGD